MQQVRQPMDDEQPRVNWARRNLQDGERRAQEHRSEKSDNEKESEDSDDESDVGILHSRPAQATARGQDDWLLKPE